MTDDLIPLASGTTRVAVTLAGGCIAAYATETDGTRHDWLRRASTSAIARGDPLGMSCFPLVPFSNRIRNGRFQAGRHAVVLPANEPGEPHAIHGHGWQRRWRVAERGPDRLLLVYAHAPDAWPFAYEAWQRFALDGPRLAVEIGLRNTGAEAMPAGIGLHPYIARVPGLRLEAAVDGVWLSDAEVLPTAHAAPPPPAMDIRSGATVDDLVLDNCFTGWDRRAGLAWPGGGARLGIEATAPLDFLVVYSPADRSCLCVEPVSHIIDGFNLAARGVPGTGTRLLAPGEELSATVTFTPSLGQPPR
ncbi:MAG: aldose 1-epimerase [Rhodospirillaceae bacterium]|nr:aldose 1-epimerase [Rhodospirillaceae bacterium]